VEAAGALEAIRAGTAMRVARMVPVRALACKVEARDVHAAGRSDSGRTATRTPARASHAPLA
jgi:hypothetical protein